jgi:hypothetical protein
MSMVERVNPAVPSAKIQLATPYHAIASRDARQERPPKEQAEKEPQDMIELHGEEEVVTVTAEENYVDSVGHVDLAA